MAALFSHPRFWLFAPFGGLIGLAVLAFGLWHMAANGIRDELAAGGLSWQKIDKGGFPARIGLHVDAPQWRDRRRLWRIDGFSLTMMPFQGGHAIIDFTGTHEVETAALQWRLAHQGNLASLVADSGGVLRGSFEVDAPRLSGGLKTAPSVTFSADQMGVHGRRSATPDHYDMALVVKQLALPAAWGRSAQEIIPRLDVLTNLPRDFLTNGAAAGQKLTLERLTLERGALTLIARGTVKLAADGFVRGKVNLEALKLEPLIDLLQEFQLISARDRAKWLFLGGLGAALGGNPQDRLSVPLIFKDGRTLLGPLDLGASPRWR